MASQAVPQPRSAEVRGARLINDELWRMAQECPEALTDEEVMLVLCDTGTIPDSGTSEYLFAEIFRRYQRRVATWCFRVTHNRARAHDLAQEIFFKAYRHRHGFRGESRLSTWLYVITRNHCLSSMKKIADPVEIGETMPLRLQDFSAPQPDVLIERRQKHQEMWQMIGATLEPMEARVMALHYGYEVPLAAITRKLALTNPSGAKAYVVNARRKLNLVIKRRASRPATRISGTAA